MEYTKSEFSKFSPDADRVIVNLEMAHNQWVDAHRELSELPVSMFWKGDESRQYLAVKNKSTDSGERLALRCDETEKILSGYQEKKAALKARISALNSTIGDRAAMYRSLRLPVLPDKQAEILRKLDVKGLLGNDLMVVGTNAFAAYELACGAKFPVGVEETEDFDLAWCKYTKVSLSRKESAHAQEDEDEKPASTLFSILREIDPTYKINPRKPYQAVNDLGYEVELLAAPSTHPLPANQQFDPMSSLTEQEWLLQGRPMSHVISTIRLRSCPLYVPDPRWMALHKLWLSKKAIRDPRKKPKDARQGNVLLDATRHFLADAYPINIDFVLELPEELRDVFNAWASDRSFDPGNPG